jgi:hypothetical protein
MYMKTIIGFIKHAAWRSPLRWPHECAMAAALWCGSSSSSLIQKVIKTPNNQKTDKP